MASKMITAQQKRAEAIAIAIATHGEAIAEAVQAKMKERDVKAVPVRALLDFCAVELQAAIRAAQLWLWQQMKLAVEPAAALGLAALQTGAYQPAPDETVCLVICGANLDPATLNGG